jgi:hypothetical protein
MANELRAFAQELVQDVLATAEATSVPTPEAFTQRVIEHLTEAGELTDAFASYHSARGVEVSGYGLDPDSERVDVFVTSFKQEPLLSTLSRTDIETLVRRLSTFARRCLEGYKDQIDDTFAAYDMVLDLERALKTAVKVRLFVLTNSTSKTRSVPVEPIGQAETTASVWDIERLHRLLTSGSLHEPIVVDFLERFGEALPCLATPTTDDDYSVLLTIVPGLVLDNLYGEFGTRLLELNVRSFLQAKGAVNRGIRDTLLKHPERFLAYNNGISATASRVELVKTAGGATGIARLHDLQIVNGGQTTASIHTAARKDGADLSQVFVQAKLTVVSPERIEEIVPSISKFSNTQNKVTTADFSSNAIFHVELEKRSRSIWAPSPTGDGQETHWFYERARGQYADALSRQGTPTKQKAWKINNPTRQKFTKTDLAKFENSYAMLPHIVSRGAEKNFFAFMSKLADEDVTVDDRVFTDLVAKAILFKETERVVSDRQFGGYRANIVTYTIAKLSSATSQRLDLEAIWRAQGISPALRDALSGLCVPIQESLTNPPRAANIGEWCKRVEAWTRVEAIAWRVPADLAAELVDPRERRRRAGASEAQREAAASDPLVDQAALVPASTWNEVAAWAKEVGHLTPLQRGLAHTLGKRAARQLRPSPIHAEQGLLLLGQAAELGFVASEATRTE